MQNALVCQVVDLASGRIELSSQWKETCCAFRFICQNGVLDASYVKFAHTHTVLEVGYNRSQGDDYHPYCLAARAPLRSRHVSGLQNMKEASAYILRVLGIVCGLRP